MTKTTDPVCGMTVDVENPPAKTKYGDRYYYFCAESCKDAFEQNPQHYASAFPGLRETDVDEQQVMTHPPARSPADYGRSPFRSLPLARIAAWALGLNAAWEFMQCTLLYDMSGWSFARAALWMWSAILGDVLIVLGVAYVALRILGLRRLLPLNLKRSTALLTIGLAGSLFLEWIARILNLWDYTAAMPTVALFGHTVGLAPVLQITLLPTLSVYLAGRTETNTSATMY